MDIFENNYTNHYWINKGRKKVLDLFLKHEYGYRPDSCNDRLIYTCINKKEIDNIILEKIEMKYNNHPMYFYIALPRLIKNKIRTFISIIHPERDRLSELFNDYNCMYPFIPIKKIIDKGYAIIMLQTNSVALDNNDAFNSGIFKAMESKRSKYSWGVLQAWSYACSKIIDYLQERKEFDVNHIAIVGHSRGGKCALLTGAIDERICLTIANCSGCSGAALSRNNTGETIKDITDRFPYWFNKKYKEYANNEEKLPFDQHQLIGLIAPRYCYISSASLDSWANPEGELNACKYASSYYKLYGIDGLIVNNVIINDVSYNNGRIAYHIKNGSHDLLESDWDHYITYFNNIL